MLKVQLSIPDLKAQVLALREMAQDPMALLQSLSAELRPRFEEWMNDLLVSELSLHLSREPYERRKEPRNHRNGYRSRRLTLKGLGTKYPAKGLSYLTLLLTRAEIRKLQAAAAAEVRSLGSYVSKVLADDLKRRGSAKRSNPALGKATDKRQPFDSQVWLTPRERRELEAKADKRTVSGYATKAVLESLRSAGRIDRLRTGAPADHRHAAYETRRGR